MPDFLAMGGIASRAGITLGLRTPPDSETVGVSGRIFVELGIGDRLQARTEHFVASYGDFFGKRRAGVEEVRGAALRRFGDGRPSPVSSDEIRDALARAGIAASDDELAQIPFAIEFSKELLQRLD
jgi:hypothetical protein